jgi:kynurenine formamidase
MAEPSPSVSLETVDPLRDVLNARVEVFDLGRPIFVGMPQSLNHAPFRMTLERRHGDMVRADGSSAANEIIVTGAHVGTHIDALCHVSVEGRLYGGLDAHDVQLGGSFSSLGAETISPIVRRGLLLDVAGALGMASCPPAYEVTETDLEASVVASGVTPRKGDVLLVRTGWGRLFDEGAAYLGTESGVPGPGAVGARWLSAHEPFAVGSDTIAFEHLPPGRGHEKLPAHTHLLVEAGIHIIEALDLEALAAARVGEFLFVCAPLKIVGATGSPVRPLAFVGIDAKGA